MERIKTIETEILLRAQKTAVVANARHLASLLAKLLAALLTSSAKTIARNNCSLKIKRGCCI